MGLAKICIIMKFLFKVVISFSGTVSSSGFLSLVPCSGNDAKLDEAMQTSQMNNLWGSSHEAIRSTALAAKSTIGKV